MSYTHSHQANTTHPVGVAPSHAASGVMPPSSSFQPSSGPQPATLYSSSEMGQHPSFSTSSSPVNQREQAGASTVAPRTTSLPFTWQMGSSQSKSSASAPPPAASSSSNAPTTPSSSKGFTATVAGGKLKRAFARRRKDAEPSPPAPLSKGKEPDFKVKPVPSSPSLPMDRTAKSMPAVVPSQHSSSSRLPSSPHATTSPNPRKNVPASPLQQMTASLPPPLPKKDIVAPTPLADVRPLQESPSAGSRNSIMPISPGMISAVAYISMMDQQGGNNPGEADKENAKTDLREENKESWRKSDSTNSHHTVRPGGTKSSRPGSWAESFQSSHTIVQSSRRRSALVGDADFGPAEEEDEDTLPTQSPNTSPSGIRSRNRRSMSLNIDMGSTTKFIINPPPPSKPVPDLKHPSLSISEGVAPVHQRGHAPSLSDSQPYIEPQPPRFMTTDPYGSAFTPTQLPPHAKNLQYANPPPTSFLTPQTPATAPSSFRQTAISIGVGPAAAGLAKRAVEKMGRKWGMSTSNSGSGAWSTTSTSSSATNGGPSSYSGSSHMGEVLVRTSSNQSTPSVHSFFSHTPSKSASGKHARTGGAAGSISSGVSSDPDFFAQPAGPVLGRKLRGALRSKNGVPVASGVLFGRDLAMGVRETGIHVGKAPGSEGAKKEGLFGEFEERQLAAVAVRCAQHLLRWGVQEEGLFRVNGRPTHVSKLRAEYDSGADYDMLDCSPGDLDPHAVSSVFKAYLRELPEPILTHRLQPLFDAAVNQETKVNAPESKETSSRQSTMMRGQGLPSSPKANFGGLRKPPSLSTLAMPSFHGIPPASKALLATLRGLIKQLPVENRDLVRTVVDLIKETSKVKETKMPVSNLLVVFCPSLNLTPPLLKVLCEAEGIWNDLPDDVDVAVIDARYAGVSPASKPAREDDARSDTTSSTTESDSLLSMRPSLDDPSDYHASAEESIYEGKVLQRPREDKYERAEVPTVYLDSRSQYTSSSTSFLAEQASAPGRLPYMQHAEDNGSISSDICSVNDLQSTSPPLLSSSAESVATPITSSNPSLADIPLQAAEKDQDHSEQHHHHPSASGPDTVATPVELRSQADSRPKISEPIPISGPFTFPVSPKLAPVASRRRSIPLLSSFSSSTSPQPGSSPSESPAPSPKSLTPHEQRAKKPSLKLLFSKKSTSSLSSLMDRTASGRPQISIPFPAGYSPKPGSDSSVSTPISAVTAPQSSFPGSGSSTNLPHVIDTPIDESALSLSLGFDISPPATATSLDKQAGPTTKAVNLTASSKVDMPEIKPLSINPKRTIKPGENHLRPKASTSNMSVASTASSHRLSLFEDDEGERMENWTQSVLLAADTNGAWSIQNPSSSGTNAKI